ncbi:hypothetical protein CQ018_06140 [Arthrobacter sp. MYb227]|uniref:hypothetical protein n=1 Tax=Arthrobacter sp. MYb227 TaxID=1848601 RepID=UPI000CFE00BA|nr:hypothetical protein [Arthrobacter sp. MYb227]PQZ94917.1 hypothetical protein CQ018_06140 [Arthrobacter sp. MYb227]
MGNHHHEDERYKKFYDRTPHGEIPSDERLRLATADGTDPIEESEPSAQEEHRDRRVIGSSAG